MTRVILSRLVQALLTMFVVLVIIFATLRSTGDPTAILLPIDAPREHVDKLRTKLGLDQPVHIQFGMFLSQVVRGDLDNSWVTNQPVAYEIGTRLPNTLKLAGVALLIAVVLVFPLGVLAAVKRGTAWETAANVLAALGQAAPSFWLGIVLIHVFAVELRWLPSGGMGGISTYVLPALTLALLIMGGLVRLLRSSMIDVLDAEFIKFARTKGVSETVIIWKHALRNALIGVVTFGALLAAQFMTGAIVVETVFAWPGLGRLLYERLSARDFPVVQGLIILFVGITVLLNLIVDILYSYIDPRIRVA